MPGAAYMVSNMSAMRCLSAASNCVTGAALVRSRGSGYSRMASVAMGLSQYLEKTVNVLPNVRPLLGIFQGVVTECTNLRALAAGCWQRVYNSMWLGLTRRPTRPGSGSKTGEKMVSNQQV